MFQIILLLKQWGLTASLFCIPQCGLSGDVQADPFWERSLRRSDRKTIARHLSRFKKIDLQNVNRNTIIKSWLSLRYWKDLPGGTSPALCLCNSLSTCLLNFDSSANDNLHTSQTKGLLNKKMLATTSECFRIIEQICTHCQTSIAER